MLSPSDFAPLLASLFLLTGCTAHQDTLLMTAAARDDVGEIQRLTAQGASANEQDSHGCTALIAAARAGSVNAIATLLRLGANPDLPGGVNHWTPMMHAIHKARRSAVAALLNGGADPNAKTPEGGTALIMAAGYGDAETVRLLLAIGADAYAVTFHGVTALSAAVGGVPDIDKFTVADCQTDTVKALLEKAPDLKLPNTTAARVAVRFAKWGKCTDVLKELSGPQSR